MSNWQPISTAPKDETSFLAFEPAQDAGAEDRIVQCFWLRISNYWVAEDKWRIAFPTHWMPLPDPPKQEETK